MHVSRLGLFLIMAALCGWMGLGAGCGPSDVDGDADTDTDVDGDGDGDGDGDVNPDCGNGECGEGEDAQSCPDDCPADCGDGLCTHDEAACGCPDDCDAVCGDGCCTGEETNEFCPDDCDAGCGNGICDEGETAETCPVDCPEVCGDGLCTGAEDADTCPDDCASECGDGVCTHDEDAESCEDDCPAVCGDGACTHDEDPAICPDDCEAACGDGICSPEETAEDCEDDCPAICGDGACTHDEDARICPDDCPATCGDGVCSPEEDAASCEDDCPSICGDTFCTHDEDALTCPADCTARCGDGFCTHDETNASCPGDCPASCGDGSCTPPAENAARCPADCDAVCDDGFCTHDEFAGTCPEDCPADCGDLACTHTETAASCPRDCLAVCGDDLCTHDEYAGSCPEDCAAVCGDGSCTHAESAATCGRDCPASCGDTFCTHDESAGTCPGDCRAVCGDSFCTHTENARTCAADCPEICGDTYCTHTENACSCDSDCGGRCGDGCCTDGETAASCSADCVAGCGDGACTHAETACDCPGDCPQRCGDTCCTHAENASTCPGDCRETCGDTFCTHTETACTCDGDCGGRCGDGCCTDGETAGTCVGDCPEVCGDTFCTHTENASTCSRDCPAVCGDTFCTHAENASTCPGDCPARCGDTFCTHAETACSCDPDCPGRCGDGCCTDGETPRTCPADCGGICGNGIIEGEEECDDGNTANCDGCSPTCTVELAWSRGAMLLRDGGTFPAAVTDLLTREGFPYSNVNNGAAPYISSDPNRLLAYPMVIFYNYDRAITAGEQTALERYIQCGGVLMITGYDSMGHPTDPLLASVARVTTSGDYTGQTACRVTADTHPATTGPYGDYAVGATFSVVESDHDMVAAAAGSVELISVGTYDKLTYADDVGTGHGRVYYWNGNNQLRDWTDTGIPQNIFLNILDWHLHSVGIVYDGATPPAALTSLLSSNCFTNAGYNNGTGTRSGSFYWLHRHPYTIFYNNNRAITADEETALTRYVNYGGMLLVTGYDSLGHPADPRLANVCHVRSTGVDFGSGSCTVTDAAHFALRGPFGTYAAGSTFTVAETDHDNATADAALGSSQLISVGTGATTVAKLTYATDLGLDGTVYYWNGNNGAADWTAAGTPRNIFLNLLAGEVDRATTCGHTGADLYALAYDFYQFDMPAANLLRRAVTYGFGTTPVVGVVSQCVDATGATHPANPGGPYAGELNATIGALRQAGHPVGSIITLANVSEATSRIAEIDVLLFPEHEACAVDAATWTALVTSFVSGGGRVVSTNSFASNNVNFLNGLGIFGTGSAAAVDSAPYTAAADAFWTGISHPGELNGTYCWNRAGAGLVPLGWRSSSASDLTVWGYNVP